jgi:CRP-like cAMP-binding protein
MFIDLGDLSKGMGMIFMREFMETAEKMSCDEGRLLFRKGDPTHHFYTLMQGELRLTIGADEHHVYSVRQAGDIFGWSSLVGGNIYSATAVCIKPSEILRFDRDKLLNLLDKHPESGFLFFKKLSQMLGKRLLEAYRIIEGEGDCHKKI